MKRRTFDEKFKRDAVRLLLSSKRPLNEVARELDVVPACLFRWRAQYGEQEAGKAPEGRGQAQKSLSNDERAELERLRRRVAELEEDREILKKAAAFFARENK